MIHSSTLGIQRKVTKLPCFWCLVFRTQFQCFLGVFWRYFFAAKLALVSMITITLISSVSVFPCRERGFSVPAENRGAPVESRGFILRCCGDLTCGYFRGCRTEAEKPKNERVVVNSSWTGQSITGLRQ